MKLLLKRKFRGETYTIGDLYIDGVLFCNTLEVVQLNMRGLRIMADIKQPISYQLSRHTWATIVKNFGTPMSVISEGLGHTSERTTQIYLKEFDTSVIDKVNEEAAKW